MPLAPERPFSRLLLCLLSSLPLLSPLASCYALWALFKLVSDPFNFNAFHTVALHFTFALCSAKATLLTAKNDADAYFLFRLIDEDRGWHQGSIASNPLI
ncbi:hypothetical protein C8J57DRAFT_1520485 [Mycena rebaudengoi]|nr:hypothetical protein C8J57DRAFT_1520485 [Mycena rebaudengoi]